MQSAVQRKGRYAKAQMFPVQVRKNRAQRQQPGFGWFIFRCGSNGGTAAGELHAQGCICGGTRRRTGAYGGPVCGIWQSRQQVSWCAPARTGSLFRSYSRPAKAACKVSVFKEPSPLHCIRKITKNETMDASSFCGYVRFLCGSERRKVRIKIF